MLLLVRLVKFWIDTRRLKNTTSCEVSKILENNILPQFGVPTKIIIDNESYPLVSTKMVAFCESYGTILVQCPNYYP
jgi:hypothetical protein